MNGETVQEPQNEITRPILTRLNEDGSHSAQSVLTPTQVKTRAECLITPRLVIPVIFLPGIMGTRLRSTTNKDQAAWAPPENTWETLLAALSYLAKSAADRQKMLDPDATEVDDNGPALVTEETAHLLGDAKGRNRAERAKQRGWSQLHADSYGQILNVIEQRLAAILSDGKRVHTAWAGAVMDWQKDKPGEQGQSLSGAQRLGAQKDFKALDDAALQCLGSAYYPVHAVGYNWLQSNKKSGERLASEIRRITQYYRDHKKVCEKVIVVTHSMGGLVSRSGMQEEGMQETILGVLHGVQPAIGAPAVYKRMRAGFEGAAQVVLGRNAAESTAVLANAAGPSELLPTSQYRARDKDGTQRHWLRASHVQGQPGQAQDKSVPLGEGDCYQNIYLNNHTDSWWRMVKEELIDPVGKNEREKQGTGKGQDEKKVLPVDPNLSDFSKFSKVMEKVLELHTRIENKYHPITYAYYAADPQQPSWNEVHWKCEKPVPSDYVSAATADDDLNGTIELQVGQGEYSFEIQGPEGPGDGTVPAESGEAPGPHAVQMFKHEGKAKGHTSYDHQFSYNNAMTQAVTLYSIARLAVDSQWLQARKDSACN